MYDLSKLYIRIDQLKPGEKILEAFPELDAFPEFHPCTDNMIKIAILSGDIDSPFVRIKEREAMVIAIFEYLGISHKTERSFLNQIVTYRHPLVNAAWLRYIQILHETDFTDWLLAKKDYEFFIAQSNAPQMDKESDLNYYKRRNETRERVKELGKEVREIEAKIFPDSKAAREAALTEGRSKIKLYAESYAEGFTYK